MFGFKPYNYESFTREMLTKEILFAGFAGPKPGERAPDFEARTLGGQEITLSEFRGTANVVLIFGSATCPFTGAGIRQMNELYTQFNRRHANDVRFFFVYVREAHPGERLPAHQSLGDKEWAARRFRDEEKIKMPILLDDLKGSIHKNYGKLPSAAFIVDKAGRIAFRSRWAHPHVVAEALEELLQLQGTRGTSRPAIVHGGEDTSMPSMYAILHAHRALERGGRKALEDFRREMGVSGQVVVAAGRALKPIADHPRRTAALAGITVAVALGSVFLGRYLRERYRYRTHPAYQYGELPRPRRVRDSNYGDYEAVGI
jgi:peroxiredoxin